MRRLVIAALLAAACDREGPAAPAQQSTVVRRGALEDRFTLTGEVAATNSEDLRVPRTPSFSIAIKWIVDDGAEVKKGDKLVEFDTSGLSGTLADRRLAVQRAETELASERARTTVAEADKQMEVERKRAALAKALIEANVPADLRARREYQEKQMAVAKEKDAVAKAEEELRAQQRAGRLDRQIKQIALTRARRELTELETRLDELTLRAPRDGLVQLAMNFRDGNRKYQIGDTAYAGTAVASMPDLSVMQVRARLHDVDEGAIRAGMKSECVLDAHPGRTLTGTVATISPVARPEGRDAVRRIFDVVVKLDPTDADFMLPGMSARVEVIRRRVDGALLVPRQSLRAEKGKTFARLASGRDEEIEIEFCALQECAVRKGPPEGTVLAVVPPSPPARS